MLRINLSTLLIKIIILISTFSLIYSEVSFCKIKADCECQPKKNTSDESIIHNSLKFSNENLTNFCDPTIISKNSLSEDPKLNYEVICKTWIQLNTTHSNQDTPMEMLQENKSEHNFTLLITYPCTKPDPPKKIKGYSTGSILVIIFFTLLFSYLGLGMSVNFFLVGARGVEMVPNLDFWRDFPALVLDGVKFLQNRCTARPSDLTAPSGSEGYESI